MGIQSPVCCVSRLLALNLKIVLTIKKWPNNAVLLVVNHVGIQNETVGRLHPADGGRLLWLDELFGSSAAAGSAETHWGFMLQSDGAKWKLEALIYS